MTHGPSTMPSHLDPQDRIESRALSCLGRGGHDGHEVGRFKAGAADQRAIDVRHAKNLDRVRCLRRAAVENADVSPIGGAVALVREATDGAVHFADLHVRRQFSRTYRPDRLISYGEPGTRRDPSWK